MFRFQRNAWFDIHLGDDFVELLVFSTMLGSTVALGRFDTGYMVLPDYVAIPQVQLLDKVQCPDPEVHRQWSCCRCSSSSRSSTSPSRRRVWFPWLRTVQQTIEIPRLQFLDKDFNMPVAGPHRCYVAIPQVQLLDKVVMPVVQMPDPDAQSQWRCRSCSFLFKVVNISVGAQRQLPMVSLFSRPRRFSCCSTLTRCSTIWLCKSSKFLGCSRGEDGRDPTVATLMLDTVVHMPVLVQRQVPGLIETVQKLWEFRSWHCPLGQVDDMPAGVSTF